MAIRIKMYFKGSINLSGWAYLIYIYGKMSEHFLDLNLGCFVIIVFQEWEM